MDGCIGASASQPWRTMPWGLRIVALLATPVKPAHHDAPEYRESKIRQICGEVHGARICNHANCRMMMGWMAKQQADPLHMHATEKARASILPGDTRDVE